MGAEISNLAEESEVRAAEAASGLKRVENPILRELGGAKRQIDKNTAEIKKLLATIDSTAGGFETTTQSLTSSMALVLKSQDALSKRLDALESRLESRDKKVAGLLDARLDEIAHIADHASREEARLVLSALLSAADPEKLPPPGRLANGAASISMANKTLNNGMRRLNPNRLPSVPSEPVVAEAEQAA